MIPIFVINLDRSPERWKAMQENFKHDELTRFKAVDGGTYTESEKKINEMIPAETACAKSHVAVWKHIVDNEIPLAIVFEDDVEPSRGEHSVASTVSVMSKVMDFDVLFLQENFEDSYIADDNNNYLVGWGAHAYAMTNEGAEKSIKAMTPIIAPVDQQWIMSFERSACFMSWKPKAKNIVAKVIPNGGIIKHSEHAAKSTFTESGEKPWALDNRFKGGH